MTIDLRTSTDYEVLRAAKVLARIDEVAHEAGVDYLVVGATARSLVSFDLLGRSPARQTRDVDIAAEVGSWGEFDDLVQKFDRHGDSAHKFIVEGDALDLATMIEWYSSGKYVERLYGEDFHVLEKFDYEPPPAGAWLLGSHVPALLDDDGIAELLRILDDDELMGRLARDMGSPRAALVLEAMSRGIRDVVGEAGRATST